MSYHNHSRKYQWWWCISMFLMFPLFASTSYTSSKSAVAPILNESLLYLCWKRDLFSVGLRDSFEKYSNSKAYSADTRFSGLKLSIAFISFIALVGVLDLSNTLKSISKGRITLILFEENLI